MSDGPKIVLDYAPKPRPWARLLAIRRRTWVFLGLIALFVFAAYSYVRGPTSGQIRLDTGDLRYCWYGIPVRYRTMPEPQRSKLLALASKAPPISAKWVTCVTYPLPTSNNSDAMCVGFYWSIAIWSDEDPKIARWAMDDVANYILGMPTAAGLPHSFLVLSPFVVDKHTRAVKAGWRDQDWVKLYCADHGYIPPPAPATRP
jgi:hypothetical protein